MKTSAAEALDLLRKWNSERTPLRVLLVIPQSNVAVQVSGFINGLTHDILVSDGTKSPDVADKNFLTFPSDSAASFEYVEAKDVPRKAEIRQYLAKKHGPVNLRIELRDGSSVSFFEAPV